MKFGDRYIKFMKDRYGIDELYKFLLLICFVLIVINTFISNNIIRLFEVLLIVIIFYRYMSKNIKLRKKENDKEEALSRQAQGFGRTAAKTESDS